MEALLKVTNICKQFGATKALSDVSMELYPGEVKMCIRDSYGAAEQYLTFEHDEFTMKPTLDENGRLMLRAVSYTHLDVYKRQVPHYERYRPDF